MKTLVSLCTYNEVENLGPLLDEILRQLPSTDVLIVDDSSPDGTGQLAYQRVAADSRINLLVRPAKLGLGTALAAACRFAIDGQYEALINLDADFSHPPAVIPALVQALDRVDVSVASRYVPGGGVIGWGWGRHFMSRSINYYARVMLGLSTRDNSGSFRCYRVSKLQQIDWSRIRAKGYAIQEELLYRCRQVGCTFEEVPFVFAERRFGQSKINWKEAVSALWILGQLRFTASSANPGTDPSAP